jgi:hypothetical protein
MRVLTRGRRVLARRPWLYWLLVVVLALTAGYAVVSATAGVERAREAWGATGPVVVATEPAAAGEAVVATTRRLPLAMIPADAVRQLPAGAVARQEVAAGEVVVHHDVVAADGPAALVPPGWQAVAVAEPVASGVDAGDRVAAASGGIVLAPDGLVVGTTGDGVLVAVPAEAAARVAAASAQGELMLLLAP